MPKHNNPLPAIEADSPAADAMSDALDWLVRLESDEPGTEAAFQAWLEREPAHAAAFALAERAWNSQLTGAAADLASQRLAAPPAARAQRPHRRWQRWAIAASLLLAVFVGVFGDLPTRMQADHLTARGGSEHLQLEDGSRVLLGSDSALAVSFDVQARRVRLLRGEAYFEVVGGQPRPFVIQADSTVVRVVGTAFAVRHLQNETRVSVRSGVVEVRDARGASLNLVAGQQVSVNGGGLGEIVRIDADQALAWTRGRLAFEAWPLGEVVAELQRHYPGWILLSDETLAAQTITGNYRLDRPQQTLQALADLTDAKVQAFPGGLWIHR